MQRGVQGGKEELGRNKDNVSMFPICLSSGCGKDVWRER